MTTSTLSPSEVHLGMPTAVEAIDEGLHLLWEQNETAARASLMNLAVYSEDPDALGANTKLVEPLTHEHACRVLLIEARRESSNKHTEAWVTAHCSLGPNGEKAVCCEQLAFRMHGCSPGRLTNLLFAHLDSDLPLVLWWQASLTHGFGPDLYSRIDRLILDSQLWQDPQSEFARLLEIYKDRRQHFVIHDLSWARTLHLRLAIAAAFEDAYACQLLAKLEGITIAHAPSGETTARLLGGWLGERLQEGDRPVPDISFENVADRDHEGAIDTVTFHLGGSSLSMRRGKRFYHWIADASGVPQRFPSDPTDTSTLLTAQLGRGGNNAAYWSNVRRAFALSDD